MNVRRLMSDNSSRNVRRRNKGPHGNKVANGQPGPANGGAMVRRRNPGTKARTELDLRLASNYAVKFEFQLCMINKDAPLGCEISLA